MERNTGISPCHNIDCPRNAECKRYIQAEEYYDYEYKIENMCFEKNNYAYFIRKD